MAARTQLIPRLRKIILPRFSGQSQSCGNKVFLWKQFCPLRSPGLWDENIGE